MATIAAGNTAEIYVPITSSLTFTPGSGGTMRLGFSVQSGSAAIAPQTISAATTVSVSAGATVFAQAINADAIYSAHFQSEGVSRSGVSLASPLATLSGVTSGLFSAAGFPYSFAPGELAAVGDVLHVMAMVRKRGANATATINAYLGVNNSTSDGAFVSLAATNVDNQDVFLAGTMFIGSTTNGIANTSAAWNSQGQNRFSNIVLTPGSTMYLNIGVVSANALDSFDLLAVRHWIEKAAA